MLRLVEAHGSRAGSFSRGSIALLLWATPVALAFACVVGIQKFLGIAFPSSDPHLFKRVMTWGMVSGLIGGLVIWRYVTTPNKTKDADLQ